MTSNIHLLIKWFSFYSLMGFLIVVGDAEEEDAEEEEDKFLFHFQ
jgi:hypothetical protein